MSTTQNFWMPGFGIQTTVAVAEIIGDDSGTKIRFNNGYELRKGLDGAFNISQFTTDRKVCFSINTTDVDKLQCCLHRFEQGCLRITEGSIEWQDEDIMFVFTSNVFTLNVNVFFLPHCEEEEEPVEPSNYTISKEEK